MRGRIRDSPIDLADKIKSSTNGTMGRGFAKTRQTAPCMNGCAFRPRPLQLPGFFSLTFQHLSHPSTLFAWLPLPSIGIIVAIIIHLVISNSRVQSPSTPTYYRPALVVAILTVAISPIPRTPGTHYKTHDYLFFTMNAPPR